MGIELYSLSMPPTRESNPAAPTPVPESLKCLVEHLASLNDAERELVIRAATRQRRPAIELKAVPWESLWQARGVVAIGGNAVEDCDAIYDV